MSINLALPLAFTLRAKLCILTAVLTLSPVIGWSQERGFSARGCRRSCNIGHWLHRRELRNSQGSRTQRKPCMPAYPEPSSHSGEQHPATGEGKSRLRDMPS